MGMPHTSTGSTSSIWETRWIRRSAIEQVRPCADQSPPLQPADTLHLSQEPRMGWSWSAQGIGGGGRGSGMERWGGDILLVNRNEVVSRGVPE
jgi:hypothetical protein